MKGAQLTPEQRHGAELLRDELRRLFRERLYVMELHMGANEIAAHYSVPLPEKFFAFEDDLTGIGAALDHVNAQLGATFDESNSLKVAA